MKRAVVTASDPISRICTLETGYKKYDAVIIPYNLNYLKKGYRILFDEDENVVVALIGIPDQIDQDPLSASHVDVPTSSDFKQSESIVEGDYFHNLPEAGYIGLLRGFVGLFGTSPLSQLIFVGTKKLARLIAANLDMEFGAQHYVRVHTNDGTMPPEVDIQLGLLKLKSDTKTYIQSSFDSFFDVEFKQDSYTLKLYNPTTKVMETVMSANYSNPVGKYKNPDWSSGSSEDGPSETVGHELYFTLAQKLFLELADVVIRLRNVQVSANKFIVAADQLSMSAKNGVSLHGKAVDVKADGTLNLVGGNVKVNVQPSGSFTVGTAGDGGIKVDPIMVQISSGKSGIQLNGTGDFMVSGVMLQQLLTQLVITLGKMTALIPLGPAAGPGIPPVVADLGVIGSFIPQIINPLIRHGKTPMPILQ